MCHAHVDPKFMMRETEDRFRASQAATQAAEDAAADAADTDIPPHLIPGWRGVSARLTRHLPRLRGAVVHTS